MASVDAAKMPPAHQINPPAAAKSTRMSGVESAATLSLCPDAAGFQTSAGALAGCLLSAVRSR